MLPHDMQLTNEYRFSRKHIDKYIRAELEQSRTIMDLIKMGVGLLENWRQGQYYQSKMDRLAQIEHINLHELTMDLMTGVAYITQPELFTSVSGQLARRLHFNHKDDSILTVAEMLAVLADTDLFDITKRSTYASLMLVSNIGLSEQLMKYIANSQYLPPMVCEPEYITTNRQSAYLTHDDNVILKRYNHHDEDICLDVVNLQNSIPLSLSVEFLKTVEELPPKALTKPDPLLHPAEQLEDIRERVRQWEDFKSNSREVYALLVGQGNRFWLTHKVDKRGRLYSQGYHVSSQGSKYKKGMLELADKELVEGVPT